MVELEGEGLARLRENLYRFFTVALLYPEEDRLSALRRVLSAVGEDDLAPFAFHRAWSELQRTVRDGIDRTSVEREYVRLFSVARGGPLCPPHESHYVAVPGRGAGLVAVQLEAEYRRLGLSMSREARTLPDHVAVEMEAMALLCDREALAWASRSPSRLSEVLEAERSFLANHLGRWFPWFSRCVLRRGQGFYVAVVAAADSFVKHDVDLTRVLAQEVMSLA